LCNAFINKESTNTPVLSLYTVYKCVKSIALAAEVPAGAGAGAGAAP